MEAAKNEKGSSHLRSALIDKSIKKLYGITWSIFQCQIDNGWKMRRAWIEKCTAILFPHRSFPGNFLAFELLPQLSSEYRGGDEVRTEGVRVKRNSENENEKKRTVLLNTTKINLFSMSVDSNPKAIGEFKMEFIHSILSTFIVRSLHLFEFPLVRAYIRICIYTRIHWINDFKLFYGVRLNDLNKKQLYTHINLYITQVPTNTIIKKVNDSMQNLWKVLLNYIIHFKQYH